MIPEIEKKIKIIKESNSKQDCLDVLNEIYKYGLEPGINIHNLLRQIGLSIDELEN